MTQDITDPLSLVGATLEGKYSVDAYVARGGFGVVYRGQHLRLRRPVAIKVLRLDVVPGTLVGFVREQFDAEACLVAQLEHPAIVRVLDYGTCAVGAVADVPWMATEWVDGVTLADDLRARQPGAARSPAACLALLRPVFEALIHAHELGIVHRDIKPANLMFTGAAEDGERADTRVGIPRLKLLDFGIAKVMAPEEVAPQNETVTRSAQISYSVKYGAPEQFSGARTGPWTDIHALALVLTEMLLGRRAYVGNDSTEFLADALNPRRPTPGRHGVDVGPWEPVLTKALAIRPGERFESMTAFLQALEVEVPRVSGRGAGATPAALPPLSEPEAPHVVADISTLSPSLVPPRPSPPARRGAVGAGLVVAAAAAGWLTWRAGEAPPRGLNASSNASIVTSSQLLRAAARPAAPPSEHPAQAPTATPPADAPSAAPSPPLHTPSETVASKLSSHRSERRGGRRHRPTPIPVQ